MIEECWLMIDISPFYLPRTQINFTVAIDFTASNGEITYKNSCLRQSALTASMEQIQIYVCGEPSVS